VTSLAAITIGGSIDPWLALGFAGDDGAICLANGALQFVPEAPSGLIGLSIVGATAGSIEGIPVEAGAFGAPNRDHVNGAFELDHVVVMTDSLERTSAVVTEVLGIECRRVREAGSVRQAFHRFADVDGARGCIVEIVERPGPTATSLWGIVVNVIDLDALAPVEHVAPPKVAVQPGRRIAGVDQAAGHGVPLAFMSA
jgi:hypothetical protein